MEVVFLLAAEQDLQQAYDWVAEHRHGKEQSFLHDVESRLEQLSNGLSGDLEPPMSSSAAIPAHSDSKLAAGRRKDIDFVRGMIQHGIVSQVSVGRLIGSCPDPQLQKRLSERFTIAVGLTQIGDEHRKKPGLSDPVRRAINEGRGKRKSGALKFLSGAN